MIKNNLPETNLRTSDFYYELPQELIAQTPMEPRDHSRLMVLKGKEIEHRRFYDILDYLKEGDTLVINDSKVIPARIYGEKVRDASKEFVSEASRIETLLLKQKLLLSFHHWNIACMLCNIFIRRTHNLA